MVLRRAALLILRLGAVPQHYVILSIVPERGGQPAVGVYVCGPAQRAQQLRQPVVERQHALQQRAALLVLRLGAVPLRYGCGQVAQRIPL